MSMQLLTVLQFIYMLVVYAGIMILIPAIVFYPFFEDRPMGVKFLAYLTIGNFYVMNLVFILQLLHISNRYTLLAGVVIPACLATGFIHWNTWAKNALSFAGEATYGIMLKTMGVRLLLSKLFQSVVKTAWEKTVLLLQKIAKHPVDFFGTIMVVVFVFWQYGTNTMVNLGYMASDTPVHNYWINSMCDNQIFVAGVYPFGMHCIVYFLHEAFGMEVFALLRIIGLLQTLLIHLCLLIFIRAFSRSVIPPYIALAVYLTVDIWNENTFFRYQYSLPQEYGMIFILPAMLFLFCFIETRASEGKRRGLKQGSTVMLVLFAMNISMTLAVHFYDTMIAGLFCVAAAAAFITVIFRKEYFWRILAVGVLGIFVAVFPMAVAFAGGTPLQGSLRWGMNIMQSTEKYSGTDIPMANSDNITQNIGGTAQMNSGVSGMTAGGNNVSAGGTSSGSQITGNANAAGNTAIPQKEGFLTRKWKAVTNCVKNINLAHRIWISSSMEEVFPGCILILTVLLFCCGVFCVLKTDKYYGRVLMATAVFTLLMSVVLISRELRIPSLMDQIRCSIYLAYALPVILGFLLDCLLFLSLEWMGETGMKQLVPVIVFGFVMVLLAQGGLIREPRMEEALEKNGAITCVTSILKNEKPETYTIISAADELRMVEEYGFFMETIELLRRNMSDRINEYMVIPTPKVFVFVEKIPGDHDAHYEGSGSRVSVSSALNKLPPGRGIAIYEGRNRHVIMSRLYFWAQAFSKLYENEMSVYYEDDEFVCYEIRQNVYRPFDFSFDYGFNDAGIRPATAQ